MSPKTKEQFESIRQRSRDTIKQTALELFGRQGYHSTSISAIAKAAGVSKGLMYNYFESKEALLVEIMTEVIATGMQLLDDALAVSEVPFEQLEALLNRTVAWVQSNEHNWRLLTSLVFQPDVQEMLRPVTKVQEEAAIAKMLPLFERLGVANPLGELLLYSAMTDGVMLQYLQLGEDYPLAVMKELILERYRIGGE